MGDRVVAITTSAHQTLDHAGAFQPDFGLMDVSLPRATASSSAGRQIGELRSTALSGSSTDPDTVI